MKLLLIDDHAVVRYVTARMLASAGHEVLEAADVEAAEALYRDHGSELDAIVVDLYLKDLDGLSLVGKLDAIGPANLPILLMSADIDTGRDISAAHPARVHFIEKPFTTPVLEAALANLPTRA